MATNLRSLFWSRAPSLPGMRRRRRGHHGERGESRRRATASSAAPPTRPPSTRCSALPARSCWRCGRKASGSITICPGSVDTGMLRDQPMLKSNPQAHPSAGGCGAGHRRRRPAPRPRPGERDRRPPDQPVAVSRHPRHDVRLPPDAVRGAAAARSGRWLGARRGSPAHRMRRQLRALSPLPPADAGHRRDRVPRAADREMRPSGLGHRPCLTRRARPRIWVRRREKGLYRQDHPPTFQPMPIGRVLRLLFLALPLAWAWPEARNRRRPPQPSRRSPPSARHGSRSRLRSTTRPPAPSARPPSSHPARRNPRQFSARIACSVIQC